MIKYPKYSDWCKKNVIETIRQGTKIPYITTITENIAKVIKSGLVEVESVHINYLDPDVTSEDISVEKFIEYLIHLSQSGIFADAINWRYVDLFDSGKYLLEGDISHNNGYELNIAIRTKNKSNKGEIVEIL